MLTVLNSQKSVLDTYLHELRDVSVQTDRKRFERNLERIGAMCAVELSKRLKYVDRPTQTPLAEIKTPLIADDLVIATILRAGLPVQRGVAQVFDGAALAFVAAARKLETGGRVEIKLDYVATPPLDDKVLIIADTMMATGCSIFDSYTELCKHGRPSRVFIISVIASQPGVDYLQKKIPEAEIITAALDPELNDRFFIVPGLGDAGDLLYGPKL